MKKIVLMIFLFATTVGFGQVTLTGNAEYKLFIDSYIGTCSNCCGDIYGLKSVSTKYVNGSEIFLFTGRKVNESIHFETTYTKNNLISQVNYGIVIRWDTWIGCNGGPADRNKTYSINSCSFIQASPGDGLSDVKIASRPAVNIIPPTQPLYLSENKDLTITLPDNIDNSYYRWKYKTADGIAKDFPSFVNLTSTLKITGKDFLTDSDDNKTVYVWVEMNCDAGEKLGEVLSPVGPDYGGCSQAIWIPILDYWGEDHGDGYWDGVDDIVCMNAADEIYKQQKAEIIAQNQSRTSNIISFTYKISSPTMTPISVLDAKCSGDKGAVNFEFDKELVDGKKFLLILYDSNTNIIKDNLIVTKSDIVNLKYTITGLNTGSYYIQYQTLSSIGNNLEVGTIPLTTPVFTITSPQPLTFSAVAINPNCYDGTGQITINASGGTPPYYYTVNNQEVQFASPITIPASTGDTIIKVRDTNSCIDKTAND